MRGFGDESGSLDNLRSGECSAFALAVVAGDVHACRGPAKRAVDKIGSIPEAKWNELSDVQKRRFWENLTDRTDDLQIAYLAISESRLTDVDYSYMLYQDKIGQVRWNLFVMAIWYAALLNELRTDRQTWVEFAFDRIYGKKQSEKVAARVKTRAEGASVTHANSRQEKGVQTADCVAGAVAEAKKGGQDRLSMLPAGVAVDATEYAMVCLEKELDMLSAVP